MMMVFVNPVLAYPFNLEVYPNYVSVCPCTAITPEYVSVSVKNLYRDADTYTFTLDAPVNWKNQIQLNAALDPGEEKTLDLFLINIGCNVTPGIYTATISAESGMTGETISKTLDIEVLNCYDIELIAVDDYKETCAEYNKSVTYNVKVKNNGKFKETLNLSVSDPLAELSTYSLTLESGETKTIDLILIPPANWIGIKTISINAESETSYAKDMETIKLNIKDCYNFNVVLQPVESTVCFGESANYTLIINNLGLDDTYRIYTPDWINQGYSEVSIPSNQGKDIMVNIIPKQKGRLYFNITITSLNDMELTKTVTGIVNVEECREAVVIISPSEVSVCKTLPANYTIAIKNTGTIEDTFNLIAPLGVLEKNKVMLGPGETETINLNIDTSGIEGTKIISIDVFNDAVSDTASARLVVENCYAADLIITPENQSLCPCSEANYSILLKNSGELSDNYTLTFGNSIQQIPLNPGQSKTFNFVFTVPCDETGDYMVIASVVSEHVSLASNTTLHIKPKEDCYSVKLTTENETNIIEVCEATSLPIIVKNTGNLHETYELLVQGPEWIYISPDRVELDPGQEQEAYLYISPPYGVSEGDYNIVISSVSPHAKSDLKIRVDVTSNITKALEMNITPGVVMNVSVGNITGAVIEVGERPLWKTIIVVAITIIIIIILIIRFALLFKK
jgi:uncharacterized membrane protein